MNIPPILSRDQPPLFLKTVECTPEQAQRLRDLWEATYRGPQPLSETVIYTPSLIERVVWAVRRLIGGSQ